jgi:uncharacterized protein (TIGR00369 family)
MSETMPPLYEMMRAHASQVMAAVPYARALGFEVLDVGPGFARARAPYRPELAGDGARGVIHGGVVTALLDNLCGVAVVAALERFRSAATLDLRIDYMRAADPERDVLAEAECFHVTRTVAFVRGYAFHDSRERLIATATACFMLNSGKRWPKDGRPAAQSGATP